MSDTDKFFGMTNEEYYERCRDDEREVLPDPIERMESRAEDIAWEQCAGLPHDKIRCIDCKQVVSINDVTSCNANPDSPAICYECLDRAGIDLDKILFGDSR